MSFPGKGIFQPVYDFKYLLHVLLKTITECLVTRADTSRDSKPIHVTERAHDYR